VFSKLKEVGSIAKKEGCCAVFDGGDFFHDKLPSRVSHSLVNELTSVHSTYPCPVYANVGNHDTRISALNNLPDNPLETLFSSGVFRRMYDSNEAVISKGGLTVRGVGIPYHGSRYDLEKFRTISKGDEDWLICSAHLLASKYGGQMFKGEDIIRYEDLLELAPDVDVFCFGHWHKDQGITEIADNKWVVNIGSLTRGALSQDNIDRSPGVAVMEFGAAGSRVSIEFTPLSSSPSSEVFDVEKKARADARAMTMDSFIESLSSHSGSDSETSLASKVISFSDIPEEIRERTLEYLSKGGF